MNRWSPRKISFYLAKNKVYFVSLEIHARKSYFEILLLSSYRGPNEFRNSLGKTQYDLRFVARQEQAARCWLMSKTRATFTCSSLVLFYGFIPVLRSFFGSSLRVSSSGAKAQWILRWGRKSCVQLRNQDSNTTQQNRWVFKVCIRIQDILSLFDLNWR